MVSGLARSSWSLSLQFRLHLRKHMLLLARDATSDDDPSRGTFQLCTVPPALRRHAGPEKQVEASFQTPTPLSCFCMP